MAERPQYWWVLACSDEAWIEGPSEEANLANIPGRPKKVESFGASRTKEGAEAKLDYMVKKMHARKLEGRP